MKKNSFEADLNRLSVIVEKVEDSETPLDAAVALYKEGLELAGKCGEALRKYEKDIMILQKKAGEEFTLEPLGVL